MHRETRKGTWSALWLAVGAVALAVAVYFRNDVRVGYHLWNMQRLKQEQHYLIKSGDREKLHANGAAMRASLRKLHEMGALGFAEIVHHEDIIGQLNAAGLVLAYVANHHEGGMSAHVTYSTTKEAALMHEVISRSATFRRLDPRELTSFIDW